MDNAIKKANDRLTYLSSDKDALHYANLREIAMIDHNSAIYNAEQRGKLEGRLECRLEGKLEGKLEVAKNMLRIGLSINQIAESTGLTEDEIAGL